jgi:nicotinamidase-related amidase
MMTDFIHLNADQTALLVIDVQRALFTRPTPLYNDYKVLATINALVEQAHLFGVEVIFVQHSNDSFLKEGTGGWRFHPDLKTSQADLIIHKKQGNAFLGTNLPGRLEARGLCQGYQPGRYRGWLPCLPGAGRPQQLQ